MAFYLRNLAVVALLTTRATLTLAQTSGTGTTTRYWDCCKPSCAWNDLSTLGISSAVQSCDAQDNVLTDTSAASGCAGGTAYMCSSQSPWAVTDDLAYGFAAVTAANPNCCQCYSLKFTSGAVSGKTMIVQATNTGSDVGSTQFDLAMPGGGFGQFDACTKEWGAQPAVWGAQYGGSSTDTCSSFPAALQPGCDFRWGSFFQGSDNPTVEWSEVSCPAAITAKSGCVKIGDTPTGPSSTSTAPSGPASSPATSSSTTVIVVPTSSAVEPETTSTLATESPSPSSSGVPFASSSTAAAPYTLSSETPVASSSVAAALSSVAPADTSSVAPTSTYSYASSSASVVEPPQPTETDDDTCEL